LVIVVKVLETGMKVELPEKEIKASDLLKKLGLSISEHIVIRNGVVISEEEIIVDGDEVAIFTVKSGG